MRKIWSQRIISFAHQVIYFLYIDHTSTPCVRYAINYHVAQQVTWEIITRKFICIPKGCCSPWMPIFLLTLLITCKKSTPTARCNMSIVVIDVRLNIMHQGGKKLPFLLWNLANIPCSSLATCGLLDVGILPAPFLSYWCCCLLPLLLLLFLLLSVTCLLVSRLSLMKP